MNICILIEQEYDPNAGGVQRSTSKLAHIFKSYNHNVIVISLNNQQKDEIINGVNIFTVNSYETLNYNKLIKLLNTENTDCVINQSGYSVKITKLLVDIQKTNNFKIINTLRINPLNFITNHDLFISEFLKSKKLSFLDSALLRSLILKYHKLKQAYELNFIIKHVDAFVMLSERFKAELYQISPKLKKYDNKIHGISNPFPIQGIKFNELQKEQAILFVGRLNITQKRVDLLLEIWKDLHQKLPDWKFWVVGDGAEKDAMMSFCSTHELDRVEFFGKCDPNPFYKKSKVFHMTSAFEGFGNVLVEAQSFGCVPVMFNSYSAAQDIVLNQETGVLIKPFSIIDYVHETLELIADKDRLNNYAENAIIHSHSYSYEATYRLWSKLLQT